MCSAKLPVVRKTPALNRFLNFLKEYESHIDAEDNEGSASSLVDAKQLVDQRPDEKYLFHLALVICLKNGYMEDVFRKKENENIISCLIDPEDAPKISKDSYCKMAVELGLVEESVGMIMANPGMPLMTEIVEGIAVRIITQEENCQVEVGADLYDCLLTNFVKLVRLLDCDQLDSYSASFLKILRKGMKSTVLEKHEKLALAFRLSGISLLCSDDNRPLHDEITELWKEWSFDKNDYSSMKSFKLFAALFRVVVVDWKTLPVNWNILGALDGLLPDFVFSDEDIIRLESTCSATEINYLSFLGGCAYVTKILLQTNFKNSSSSSENVSALRKSVEEWSVKKPKMKAEEFLTESRNFTEFCRRMEEHGSRIHYQTEWLQKFLSFTPEDIFMTTEGLRIAEKFIVTSSELNIFQEYMKMAYNADSFELSDDVKKLILKTFADNEVVISQRDAVIKELFQDGVRGNFRTGEFSCSLSTLGMQLGTIEFQNDADQVKKNIASVTVVSLQDPGPTLTKLLEQSMRTHHFKALEYARPFFCLPINLDKELKECYSYDPVLVNQSFNVLLKTMVYPSSLCDCMLKSIDSLVSKKFLKAGCIFRILKYQILKDLKRNKVFLSKVFGLIVVLDKLVDFLLNPDEASASNDETDLMIDVAKLVIRVNRFFSAYTNVSTFGNAMKIRNHLVTILQKLSPVTGEKISNATPETLRGLEDLTTLEIGFLYVRNHNVRSAIETLFSEKNFAEQLSNDSTQLLSNIIEWITNSCETEWTHLVQFLIEVLLKAISLKKTCNQLHTLNQVLKSVYTISLDIKSPEVFVHTLKFYMSTVDYLNQIGQINVVDRNEIIDTLVFIGFMMSCRASMRQKEVVGLHQLLMFLLDKVEVALASNYTLEQCQKLTSNLNRYNELDSKCQSVRWLILKKLESQKDSLTP